MNCVNHGERTGINTCSVCGDWLCAECTVEENNRYYCGKCAPSMASTAKSGAGAASKTVAPAREFWDDGRGEPRGVRKRYISKFLTFMLAAVPGLNFMYMGLIKRGLFYMCAMTLSIYLTAIFDGGLLVAAIPVVFFVSFFDGFRFRRMIVEGEYVTDNIDDITSFAKKHRTPLVIGTIAVIGLGILSNVAHYFSWMMRGLPIRQMMHGGDFGEGVFAVIIVAAILYFVFGRGNKNSKDKR